MHLVELMVQLFIFFSHILDKFVDEPFFICLLRLNILQAVIHAGLRALHRLCEVYLGLPKLRIKLRFDLLDFIFKRIFLFLLESDGVLLIGTDHSLERYFYFIFKLLDPLRQRVVTALSAIKFA